MWIDYLLAVNHNQALIFVAIRTILLFLLSIIFLRFGNHRYNVSTAMDYLFIIILGSLISRGINGTSTFISTIVALITLISLHKVLAKLTCCYPPIESIFKGKPHLIVENGQVLKDQLNYYNITESDLKVAMREDLNTDNMQSIKHAYLERSGRITFVKQDDYL